MNIKQLYNKLIKICETTKDDSTRRKLDDLLYEIEDGIEIKTVIFYDN